MKKPILVYAVFIHPLKMYGSEMAKEFFGTRAKKAFVQIGETSTGLRSPLSCVKKKGKLQLNLEWREAVNGRSELWLKYWQSTYNFSGVWQVVPGQPQFACGQFSRAEYMGKKNPVFNPLKPFGSTGLLMRFNALPEQATAFELLILQDARDYVKTDGIRTFVSADFEEELCELRYNLKPSHDYGISLSEIMKQAYPDASCLPPAMTLFEAA